MIVSKSIDVPLEIIRIVPYSFIDKIALTKDFIHY